MASNRARRVRRYWYLADVPTHLDYVSLWLEGDFAIAMT